MSTTTIEKNHDQLFLPGQTAAPEGPVDMKMMYLMHHAFRRDLDTFLAAVTATPVADDAVWKALAVRWTRFATILHEHHTVEDDHIWPFLRARADETELATLEAMEAEHELIDPLLTSVADGFAALAAGGPAERMADHRNALKVRLAAARESLGRHLRHEETEAMAILQRRMTAAEWTVLEKEIDKAQDHPLPLWFVVGWIAEGLPQDVLDRVFKEVGLPFKVLWLLTRGRFRKGEAKTFAYVG